MKKRETFIKSDLIHFWAITINLVTKIIQGDCIEYLKSSEKIFDLSFIDPPFNQGKEYDNYEDDLEPEKYWSWMTNVCKLIFDHTSEGGAIYFMQREKNTKYVLEALDDSGWNFQNLIIWKKMSSAVPQRYRFGKHYQIIAFYTKGDRPRVFNRVRIDPPLRVTDNYERPHGMYATDVWDEIRELTSGFFAGDEPYRDADGNRVHKQQSPIRLLTRIILSSSNPGNTVFDPFAGTGTTLVVAKQLKRHSIGVELAPQNVELIKERIENIRQVDNINEFRDDYIHTEKLDEIWELEEEKITPHQKKLA